MEKVPIYHLIANSKIKASELALNHYQIDKDTFLQLLKLGSVYKNKKRMQMDDELNILDYLRIHPKPKRFPIPENLLSLILFESEDYLILNKPAGIPVHASLDNQIENIQSLLTNKLNYPLFVTHRIDVPVQGCLVFAKNSQAQVRFNRAIQENRIEKKYRALVSRPLSHQTLVHYMEKNRYLPKRATLPHIPKAQRCELAIEKCSPYQNYFELNLRLITGRTHQIRFQLSQEGTPILGDEMYQGKKEFPFHLQNIALQSYSISFPNFFHIEIPQPWQNQ